MAQRSYKDYHQYYGTEAPKYPYTPQPTPKSEPTKAPSKQPKPKTDWVFTSLIGACLGIVFCSSIGFIHLSSELSVHQKNLQKINAQIRETQSSINSTQAIIASHLDLSYIQKIATEQLEMAEPLPHQVVHIQLTEESYTEYNE